MKGEEINPWKIIRSKEMYANPWIDVTEHDVINPSGGKGIYGVVHFKNRAIGIIPLDEKGNTWLVGQYRFPLGQYSWEIPEGGGSFLEEPMAAAKRELEEETGIFAKRWTQILTMHLSNSVSDEIAIIYLAQDLFFGEAKPEETEQLVVKKIPFNDAYCMVEKGEITDSLSVAAILKVKLLLETKQITL